VPRQALMSVMRRLDSLGCSLLRVSEATGATMSQVRDWSEGRATGYQPAHYLRLELLVRAAQALHDTYGRDRVNDYLLARPHRCGTCSGMLVHLIEAGDADAVRDRIAKLEDHHPYENSSRRSA
jgi:hypothetical protein